MKKSGVQDACAEAIFGRKKMIMTEIEVHKITSYDQFVHQRDNITLHVP